MGHSGGRSWLDTYSHSGHTFPMSSLAEIESFIPFLNSSELERLEVRVRELRQREAAQRKLSIFDRPALNLGKMLTQNDTQPDLLGEMLDETRH